MTHVTPEEHSLFSPPADIVPVSFLYIDYASHTAEQDLQESRRRAYLVEMTPETGIRQGGAEERDCLGGGGRRSHL